MTAYYTEIDPFAAQWLRNLIAAGHIAPGDVDEGSIEEVSADDLKGYTQCHFFAGIGGWSYAARLAGWPDDQPMWTGSCPCQPFSAAGKRKGTDDERHLWPVFFELIRECSPSIVFGEQVASRLGREWFAGVRADLETLAYAVGGADLCAASVGAPHIRQRLWWVADSEARRWGKVDPHSPGRHEGSGKEGSERFEHSSGSSGGMADPQSSRQQARTSYGLGANDQSRRDQGQPQSQGSANRVAYADHIGSTRQQGGRREAGNQLTGGSGGLGDSASKRLEGSPQARTTPWTAAGSIVHIPCADGKTRRIESSIKPLVDGVPARVGRLRAYGNAIVPQVATEFIKAVM